MKVANLNKIAPKSLSYAIYLNAPPPCQVEEQVNHIVEGKGRIRFALPADAFQLPFGGKTSKQVEKNRRHKANRKIEKGKRKAVEQQELDRKRQKVLDERIDASLESTDRLVEDFEELERKMEAELKEFNTINAATETKISQHEQGLNMDDDAMRQGIIDGSIPSAIADTGCTTSVWHPNDACIPTGKASNKVFQVPFGHTAEGTEEALMHHEVRQPARTVHVVPELVNNSLVSIGKFADANYFAIFDNEKVEIFDATNTEVTVSRGAILRGWRDGDLWRIPTVPGNVKITNPAKQSIVVTKPPTEYLPNRPPPEEAICNVFELSKQPEIIRYYHAAAGFPTKPTWIKAINAGNYVTWPGLTATAVQKYFPESDEEKKGHGRKMKAGVRSTKKKVEVAEEMMAGWKGKRTNASAPGKKHRDYMIKVFGLDDLFSAKIYTDQTGKFPVRSSQGNLYLMVLAEVDSDVIMVEAMRNRTAGEMVKTYQKLMDRLKACGIHPKHQILDNEASAEYKAAIKSNGLTYELVPPHDHRRNLAEKAIQTFKAHFIAILCGVSPSFPMHLWDRLLEPAERRLNLQRQSRVVPTASSYQHLYGPHDYNKHPFGPLGCEVEAWISPSIRETWQAHTATGWYLGESMEHYRCDNVWHKDTKSVRVCGTVFFKHKYLTMPTLTPADAMISAMDSLAQAIEGNLKPSGETKAAVDKLTAIIQHEAEKRRGSADSQRVRRTRARRQIEEAESIDVPPPLEYGSDSDDEDEDERESAAHGKALGTTPGETVGRAGRRLPPASGGALGTTPGEAVGRSPSLLDANIISQDEDDTAPAYNTRARQIETRTPTQEMALMAMDMSGGGAKFTARQAASRKYPLNFLCEWANSVLDGETGELLEYRHLIRRPQHKEIWGHSFGNEIGRLAQGMKDRVKGTDTMNFIHKYEVPQDRFKDVTYGRIVCDVRPQKEETHRTRITVGGNLIDYPDDCGTPTADLFTVKMFFNSIVSTPGAKFMAIDLSNFYLNTPLKRPEYIKLKLENFPEDVIEEYGLLAKATSDGYVYCEVVKGMYGLPQAGILAQELLEKRLARHGYTQSKVTPGFWTHKWRPISFTLVVDDFGVKYVGKEHADHLVGILEEHYDCHIDWEGRKYLGITLDWDYIKRECHLSMPGYVQNALTRFQHEMPKRPQHQPHKHIAPAYGAKVQYAAGQDESRPLSKQEKTFVQQVVGVFLYYGRAVDSTMLVALSAIASGQAAPTEETLNKTKQFLDYAATHPDAVLTYKKSNMVLAVHSDASYLCEPKARSRAGGHFFMSSDTKMPPNNGAVLTVSQIIKAVMSSAAEAELGALYINAREAVPARRLLKEMGHPQPPTPMQTDNSTALGVVTNNIQPKRTKAMDMRFYWLRDREAREQFRFYWSPGKSNWADYHTKHHCAAHHKQMRPHFLSSPQVVEALRAALKPKSANTG